MAKSMCTDKEECDRPAIARGLCTKHYQRLLAKGLPPLPPKGRQLACRANWCEEAADGGLGLCNAHYKRLKETGDIQEDVPVQKKRRGRTEECGREDCREPYSAKGLCKKHYLKARREALKQGECITDGCGRVRYTVNGHCVPCSQRLAKYGDAAAGPPRRVLRGTGDRWRFDENRRAAKAKMSQVSGETAEYVAILRGDPCVYCGAPMKHIDHIVAFSLDGPTEWTNLAPACLPCNVRKSKRSVLGFMLLRLQEELEAA